jgi:hypothetical protein
MKQLWKLFTSLRLTIVLLACAIVLVFVGTVAQADEGLFQVQERYFRHWIIVGTTLWGLHMPWFIWPGGYTLGFGLLTNLVAAHIKRFQWSSSKIGIHLTHLGIIILLVGQLATDMLQVETRMSFREGETASYVEDHRDFELAFATDVEGGKEEVVAIPQKMVAESQEISHPKLPFVVRVKKYYVNADVRQRAPMVDKEEPPATQGVGPKATLVPLPEARDMDSKNMAAAIVELLAEGKSLGTWVVWSPLVPQIVEVAGKTFRMALRDERTYLPYSIKLLEATHKKYAGTDTPKDFRSRVLIQNPLTHENREVEISMNSPLRYSGLAFFQYKMTKEELDRAAGSSLLQVVRNPSWLAPYIGCIVVGVGMLWQFLHHLVGFISKRRPV